MRATRLLDTSPVKQNAALRGRNRGRDSWIDGARLHQAPDDARVAGGLLMPTVDMPQKSRVRAEPGVVPISNDGADELTGDAHPGSKHAARSRWVPEPNQHDGAPMAITQRACSTSSQHARLQFSPKKKT